MVVRFGKRESDRQGLLDSMDQVAAERPLENGKNKKNNNFGTKRMTIIKISNCFRMHGV